MKVIVVALACLLAGISAKPNLQASELEAAIRSGEPRLITDTIVNAIEGFIQSILAAGLDPFAPADLEIDYALPVPSVFSARAHVRGVESTGISNIAINSIDYAILTSKLTFNIELPKVDLKVDDAALDVNILSGRLNGELSGSVAVKNLVITGEIRIIINPITGISISSIVLKVSLGGIDSDLSLNLLGRDLSELTNNFLSETVPKAIELFQPDISELVTIIVRDIIEGKLELQ